MLSYKFDDGGLAKKDEAMNDFVSAVCWDNVSIILNWKLSWKFGINLMKFFLILAKPFTCRK